MKRKITIAVVAMAISLSGIIILQLYWINGAIKVRSKQFDGQVFDAMNDVSDKLQVHESLVILPKILPGMDSMQRKTADSMYKKRVTQPHFRGTFGLAKKRHHTNLTDNPFLAENMERDISRHGSSQDKAGSTHVREFHKTMHEYEFRDSILADSGRRLINMANMFNRMLREMKLNYIKENKDINKRLSKELIDSLLQQELSQRGIEIPYESAVFNKHDGELYFAKAKSDTNALKSTIYRVKIFPEDLPPSCNYLVVNFPDRKGFVLRSIGMVLPGSFIFLIIIVVSCAFTIYTLLKQKKLSEMKNDFINNMTHEFKTPIATISLATDAINDPRVMDNKEKLKHYTSIIKEENNRMNMQVQKVLNAALMDKNDFELNLAPMDANEVVGELIDRFRIQILERNGTLTWDAKASEHIICGDEVHFGNVINNLLDNANKYSEGAPCIKISTRNEGGDLLITVEDNGIGMDKETQNRVFDKFYRMSTGNVHNTKGFGLGLSYVKSMVTAHKGSITLKSEIKRGSTFTIRLPVYHEK
jgi:two-component system phosphate regulon sensor histidine kinase PhoR